MTFSALRTSSTLLSLLLLLIVAGPVRAQSGGVVDEIVAVVGNDIVLRSEVDGIVYNIVQQGQAQYSDGLWLEMLDQMVDQKVMAIVAERDTNITVTDSQVDQSIDGRIEQLQRQVGGVSEIERIYGKPIVQIRADLRRDFRSQLLAQQLQQQHMRSIRITPTEVRAWFHQFPTDSLPTVPESVRLSHIVRHPEITDAARDEAMEIISTIRESVVSGDATIEEMARQFSDDLWLEMLDQMVDQKVMAIVAERDTNITVTDSQVDQSIDGRIEQLQRQVGGVSEIERIYGKPIVQIRADLRRDFRSQLLAQQLQQQHMRSIRITPTEVRAWFHQFPTDSLPTVPESVRLSHIVRHPEITDAARDEAMEIISTIRESVVSGDATIEEMARQFSDDPGSAGRGGHYEGTRLSDLVAEFAAVAARSPVGEYSQIFESPFGLHFLRVNQRRGDVVDYNHVLIEFDRSKADPAPAIEFLQAVKDSIETYDLSFEVMARRHSEEQQTSMLGGRVVDLRTGERQLYLEMLGPDWRRTIQQLEVGEISEPTRVQLLTGQSSYHIVKLREHTAAHRLSLDTDYERIEQLALQEKQQRELQRWARSLRDQVHIEMRGKARDLIARN